MLNFIIWDVAPQIFTIPEFSILGRTIGPLAPVWYGLLFATGFLVGQQIMIKIYKLEGKSEKQVEILTIYIIVATIVGARLGHCFFYEPMEFLADPISILYIWKGGLASHGAGIALIFAVWRYSKKYPSEKFLYVLDRVVIIVALSACFIRFGNFMNSEIIGIPANVPQAVIFANPTTSYLERLHTIEDPDTGEKIYKFQVKDINVTETGKDTMLNGKYLSGISMKMKVKSFEDKNMMEIAKSEIADAILRFNKNNSDGENIVQSNMPGSYYIGDVRQGWTDVTIKAWGVPRHPAQLYESFSSLILFFILLFVYRRKKADTPQGLLFGIFMVWIFTLRFFYEFLKENQVGFENSMALNMGQILSIPMVLIGVWVLNKALKKRIKN
jgi:phosphatidylglycerol:prolipoprotein diacylglycerol transferase